MRGPVGETRGSWSPGASRRGWYSACKPAVNMSKHATIPEIRKYMTTLPHTIGADQTMASAHELMREHRLRHLPVMSDQRLVGIVTDGDLHTIETLRGADPEKVTIRDAMTRHVYAVSPDAPLDQVVEEMARQKYGSAIVVDNGHVVGIFTTVDACQAFADTLRARVA